MTVAYQSSMQQGPRTKNMPVEMINVVATSWDIGTDADLVIPVGKVAKYTLKDFTIDNVFMGVRAVDKDGNRSPVRTPEERVP
jgi:DeoR/GlpR family transcriptional regulator of sugar metabolism